MGVSENIWGSFSLFLTEEGEGGRKEAKIHVYNQGFMFSQHFKVDIFCCCVVIAIFCEMAHDLFLSLGFILLIIFIWDVM